MQKGLHDSIQILMDRKQTDIHLTFYQTNDQNEKINCQWKLNTEKSCAFINGL